MMIGEPTNFQHTGHIGSGEMEDSKLSLMHDQMQSKGGYDNAISPSVLKVILTIPSQHMQLLV